MQEQRRDLGPQAGTSEVDGKEQLANGLGWFSIGLGLAEVVAPGRVAQLIGLPDEDRTRGILRAYGCREIAAGIGILSQPQPAGWMWSRVAGDLLDLGTLMTAMNSERTNRSKVATATAAVLGVTALDVMCAQQLSQGEERAEARGREHPRFRRSIKVNRPPDVVYAFWRNLENLAAFMEHLESVQVLGNNRSRWRARGPAGITVEWEAELIAVEPNHLISWRALEGAGIYHSGSVRFEPTPVGRGTIVMVDLEYAPPGGTISARFAKILGQDPGQLLQHDLRTFKQVIETGEIVKSDASIHRGMHAAQPPRDEELVQGGRQ